MGYLYFLFDFDYTLVNSSVGIVISFNYALREIGYPSRESDEIKKTIGQSLEMAFYNLTGSHNHDEFLIFKEYFMKSSKRCMSDCTEIYEGVISILCKLKRQNKKIGIISSKDHFTIEEISKQNNFLQYIDIIIGEDDVIEQKPNPEAVYLAADKLNANYSEILYIGDSIGDAQTAQNAHVDFLPVISGTTKAEEFAPYKKVGLINNLYEIQNYMK